MTTPPHLEEWQVRKVMSEILFETKPRFKGCPPICLKENLPAFDNKMAAFDWHTDAKLSNPLYDPNPIVKIWQCKTCNKLHFITKPRPPSGGSSGTGRDT